MSEVAVPYTQEWYQGVRAFVKYAEETMESIGWIFELGVSQEFYLYSDGDLIDQWELSGMEDPIEFAVDLAGKIAGHSIRHLFYLRLQEDDDEHFNLLYHTLKFMTYVSHDVESSYGELGWEPPNRITKNDWVAVLAASEDIATSHIGGRSE